MKESKKILLAEDDADDRALFRMFLKHRDDIGEISAAENGIELLKMLDNLPDKGLPHLIILDQNMPKMNGLATLEKLKSDERYTKIPVMIYSTYASEVLAGDSLEKGALYVSAKPNNKEGYEKMIDKFFLLAGRQQ